MNKKVIWTSVAETDLRNTILYIANENPDSAKQIFDRIREKAESLAQNETRGRIVPELGMLGIQHYRELIIERWRLVYRPTENEVFVLGFFDSRRNFEDLLFGRLNRFL